jgi:protein disulfide-isomerase-like protein
MHHDINMLHANGIHAVPVNEENFGPWLEKYEYVFVNFYAPWCVWCQRLEPVWEALAEKVETEQLPVSVVKVDCIENRELCMKEKIQAFPNLRLFKKKEVQPPDYRSDRTVDAMIDFLRSRLALDEQIKLMAPAEKVAHEERIAEQKDDHPGCMMSGFLLVNRVPGHFHIEMRSKHHNINPPGTNLSHVVNHLSFGPILPRSATRQLESLPAEFFSMQATQPMNDRYYVNPKLHQAYHHYIKVVSTTLAPKRRTSEPILAYQMVSSSQMMQYGEEEVPEARFSYDLSPMSVQINRKGKQWYEFVTSICALIGGTFTVLGLLSGFLNVIFKSKKM